MHTRPVWADISVGNLVHNYRRLCADAPGVQVLAVIKANAYGHGLLSCGEALASHGANWLGVTSVDEGVALRTVCPYSRILVMSGLWNGEAEALIEHRLTPQVWEPYHFDLLRESAGAAAIPVHLEIDTGMSRQGVPIDAIAALLRQHARPPIEIEGVLTHFTAPEMLDEPDTAHQLARFAQALAILDAHGIRPRIFHAGNSANLLSHREMTQLANLAAAAGAQLMMRPGLSLYGYPVRFHPPLAAPALKPVLTWKTRITSLRDVPPGAGAGYNSTFVATRPTRLGLVPVGYADGLNRLLSNRGAMLVRGRRAPIAGRISMDQTILDVTDVPGAALGDEVVILGEQESERITAYDHADLCGTIPYEILCNISSRVPRIAVD